MMHRCAETIVQPLGAGNRPPDFGGKIKLLCFPREHTTHENVSKSSSVRVSLWFLPAARTPCPEFARLLVVIAELAESYSRRGSRIGCSIPCLGSALTILSMASQVGGKAVEVAVLGAVQQVEQQLDSELQQLESLQDDDIEAIRKRRIAEMRNKAENEALWRRRGHGALAHIEEKEFFQHCKETNRVIVYVTRPGTTRYAQDVQDHLARVAERHVETYFAVLNADKSPFLCEKFQLRVMPSVLLVKNHVVDKVLHGLEAFTVDEKFSTAGIERRLFDLEIVTHTDIADDE
jgi:hypothetical protein